jgi:hypothetical protein
LRTSLRSFTASPCGFWTVNGFSWHPFMLRFYTLILVFSGSVRKSNLSNFWCFSSLFNYAFGVLNAWTGLFYFGFLYWEKSVVLPSLWIAYWAVSISLTWARPWLCRTFRTCWGFSFERASKWITLSWSTMAGSITPGVKREIESSTLGSILFIEQRMLGFGENYILRLFRYYLDFWQEERWCFWVLLKLAVSK